MLEPPERLPGLVAQVGTKRLAKEMRALSALFTVVSTKAVQDIAELVKAIAGLRL